MKVLPGQVLPKNGGWTYSIIINSEEFVCNGIIQSAAIAKKAIRYYVEWLSNHVEIPSVNLEEVTFEIRHPKNGECVLTDTGPMLFTGDSSPHMAVIVKTKFKWPDWISPGWIGVEKNGRVWWYENKPVMREDEKGFASFDGECSRLDVLCPDFQLPDHKAGSPKLWRVE